MPTITFTGGQPNATIHVHAAELDASTTFDSSGRAVFTVNARLHAWGARAWVKSDTIEASIAMPLPTEAGDVIEVR